MEQTSKTGAQVYREGAMTPGSSGVPSFSSPSRGPGPAPRSDTKGMGWLMLLPIACCGGPLIIGAIAAAGVAAGAGLGAAAAVAAAVTLFVVVRRRRAASCCAPDGATTGGGSVLGKAKGPYA
jgi:hypothetical protein